MSATYRTFEDGWDNWRWDGSKMEVLDLDGWYESAFTDPEELLEEADVTETTPKP